MHSTDKLPTSFSIETLQEIVRNCQRNEQRLKELKRHARYERMKVERLLRETYQTEYKQTSDHPKSKPQQSLQYFISFDDDTIKNRRQNTKNKTSKKILKERQKKSTQCMCSIADHTHRVRFNIPENNKNIQTDHFISSNERKKSTDIDAELDKLSRQCEDLLLRLHTYHNQATLLDNDDDHLQQQSPSQLQQASKEKYSQLSETNDQLQEDLISEIQRRNHLRTEILRLRLRQHDLLYGRTKTNESLKLIET